MKKLPSQLIEDLVEDLGDNKMLAKAGWNRHTICYFIVNWMIDNNITIKQITPEENVP